jgi:outer membrane protein assembly factor BamB
MAVPMRLALILAMAIPIAAAHAADIDTGQLLYNTEGNRLRRIDVDTVDHAPLRQDVLIRNATEGEAGASGGDGRDVNGMLCALPNDHLVMGEDTGQPTIRPGWGVFDLAGNQIGKLSPTGFRPQPEPFGCAVDADGRLFTTEIGDPFQNNGQLLLWFPPFEQFPGAPGTYPNTAYSANYCKIAIDIGAASGIALDAAGRAYVASPRGGRVLRFSGVWPTGPDAAGGCGRTDPTGAALVDDGRIARETFIQHSSVATPSSIVRGPNGNWFVSSVLTSRIAEFTPAGAFVRTIMAPPAGPLVLPAPTGHPQTLAFDAQGNLYYADLNLVGSILAPDTGPNGTVRRIRFDENGDPQPPEIVRSGLAFPDAVTIAPGNLEPTEWRTLGRTPQRTYFNPHESTLTQQNVAELVKRWEFTTTAIVTGSPSVATIDLPGEGRTQLVVFQDWNGLVYAVRLTDGSEAWRFQAELQPGAGYPGSASATIETVGGADRVFIGYGEMMYALDATTGAELWRFTAGTGCRDANGDPPGLCSLTGERNQIESTPAIVNDTVVFGMDVNDREIGKGGLYGVDVTTGQMKWFFDLESGDTCRPDAGDAVSRFDGYHSAEELGLPADFFATRPGCGFDRTATGCGNVWSSPAVDLERQLLFTVSSNCDTDADPLTNKPGPTMPPYDEAIFALDFDGNPVWRWRPREVDPDDLAFGAAPNLFAIERMGELIDVLGVGGKDGTYYVLDRDGVNEISGVAWDDADPAQLPYWRRQVVPGGDIGGVIASASADEGARRIYFSTAYGVGAQNLPPDNPPQRPTMHALDMDTGAIVWDNGARVGLAGDASYAPTTGIPGVAFAGTVLAPVVRMWDTAAGTLLRSFFVAEIDLVTPTAVASGSAVVDGTLLVGHGIGTRGDPHDFNDQISRVPRAVVALCVPGTRGCGECQNGIDDDDDARADWPDDPSCESAADASEKSGYICDNGLDDDGDGSADADDPGCADPVATVEDPQCDNGIDDDENGLVDWFDPNCQPNWPYWEARPSLCGIGVELALVLPLLLSWRRFAARVTSRRRRRDARCPRRLRRGSAPPRRARAD